MPSRILFVLFIALTRLPGVVIAASDAPHGISDSPADRFAEMRICDAAGRPWRIAREDWVGARQRVTTDPAWTKWLAGERAEVEAWMARHHDRVEWVAGWSQDGVSPRDGSQLTWDDRIPGEETDHFSSPSDPKVAITPTLHAWWVVGFRNRHVEMMVRAARLGRLLDDARYREWAAGQLDFYAANFERWQIVHDHVRLFWQALSEGMGLARFTEVYRLLDGTVAPERTQAWRVGFFEPEVRALRGRWERVHNIAIWIRAALAQTALVVLKDEALWHECLDGEFGLRRQLRDGITDDSLWWEQSLGYNNFVVSAVLGLFTTAGVGGRAPELSDLMLETENLMLSPIYLRFPDGLLPCPADGRPARVPDLEFLGTAYRVFPTPLGLTAAAARRDWNTLVDPPAAAPAGFKLSQVCSWNLESSRMALLRDGRWQLFVHYGQLTRAHSQAEALNYSATCDGIDVTHDPGTSFYGSPMYTGYFKRGLTHNVPLIDGEGEDMTPLADREFTLRESGSQSPLRGELREFSAAPARIKVAQPQYQPGAGVERTLAIEGDVLRDAVLVDTRDGRPHALGLAVHVQGQVRLPGEFHPAADFGSGRPEPFGYWRSPKMATAHDHLELEVKYADRRFRLTLASPGEFRVWHAETPDTPPAWREGLYVEVIGRRAEFTTTWTPLDPP